MLLRRRLLSLALVVSAAAGLACEPPPEPKLALPEGLPLDQLSEEQQKLLRATLEISGQTLAETAVVLDVKSLTLSGDLRLDNVGDGGERIATLRVYGRAVVLAGEPAIEVLLGDVSNTIEITPKGAANLDFGDKAFDVCHPGIDGAAGGGACSLVFDQNRNGLTNVDDLIAGVDPATQPAFTQVDPQTLQFASGIRLGSFQRQVIVVENTGEHVIRIESVRVAGGQGVGVSLFDPSAAFVAPPRRVLEGAVLDKDGDLKSDFAVQPGEEAFVAVSFAPVNSFLTTATVQIVAKDDVTGVSQGASSKVIANADGSQRPPNPNYQSPVVPETIKFGDASVGDVPLLAFPTAELFSGAEIGSFGAAGTANGLASVGGLLAIDGVDGTFAMPADAAFAAVIQPKNRFTAALGGLSSDVDLALVELEDADGNPATPPTVKGLLASSRQAGDSAEAVEVVNEGAADQLVLVVLGRVDLEVPTPVAGALLASENAPFRLSCQTSRGPELDDAAPIGPSAGTLDGGITIVLKGTGFFVPGPGEPSVRVTFNGQPSVGTPRVTVDTDGKQLISAVLPPGGVAVADVPSTVVVENPLLAAAADRGADGQAVSLPDGFRYDLPTPRLISLTPDVATVDGGTLPIAIGGAFFSDKYGPPQVFFDDLGVAADFIDSSRLTVLPPAHAAGFASVTVRSVVFGGGLGEPSGQRAFNYVQPAGPGPTITAIAPDTGDAAGGELVIVTGANFDDGAIDGVRVFFGSVEATITVRSATALTVLSPAVDDGAAVDVLVLNPDGQVAISRAAYTYALSPPSIARVFPNRAILDGGTQIVVDGAGFRADVDATFVAGADTRPAAFVDRKSSTSLVITTPVFPTAATGTLVIRNGDGQEASAAFTFFEPAGDPPRIISLDPNSGGVDGGTQVTLLGSGFVEPTVLVGGTQIETVEFTAAAGNGLSSLRFSMPPKAPGVQIVSVFNADGQAATTAFTYLDVGQPRIIGLRPAIVHASVGGDEILVIGEDLDLLGAPVSASADLGLVSTPLDVSFVGDAFASVFIRNTTPLAPGAYVITLSGPGGVVTSLATVTALAPEIDRVFVDDADITIVGNGLAGERLESITVGGVDCQVRIGDERVITCRLAGPVEGQGLPPIALSYEGGGEPVVDTDYTPIVEDNTDVDSDGDGVLASDDPDDNDPCSPNPQSPACVVVGEPRVDAISGATWPNDLAVIGANLNAQVGFEAGYISGDGSRVDSVPLVPTTATATSLELPSVDLAPGDWEICRVDSLECFGVVVSPPVSELEPNDSIADATGLSTTSGESPGVQGFAEVDNDDVYFFRVLNPGPHRVVAQPIGKPFDCNNFSVSLGEASASSTNCGPATFSIIISEFTEQLVVVSNIGTADIDYVLRVEEEAAPLPGIVIRNLESGLFLNSSILRGTTPTFLAESAQPYVISVHPDGVGNLFRLASDPTLALCAPFKSSIQLCDPTLDLGAASWIVEDDGQGQGLLIRPNGDPTSALTHSGLNVFTSIIKGGLAAFRWSLEANNAVCGNGVVEAGEGCDVGLALDPGCNGCVVQPDFNCAGSPSVCTFVGAVCGNGIADGADACDGDDLRGQQCADVGFVAGTLACDGGCVLDTSGCTEAFLPFVGFVTGVIPRAIAVGDLNGDGNPDTVLANDADNSVSVFFSATAPGSVTPTIGTVRSFPTATNPVDVEIGDIDGDGKADLIVASSATSVLSVLINTTSAGALTPSFAASVDFAGTVGLPVAPFGPFSLATGDFNGDGKLDVVLGNQNSNNVSVFFNTTPPVASPSFAAPVDFVSQDIVGLSADPIAVAVADFNNDGKLDIAGANSTTNTLSVLLNTAAPGAGAPSFADSVSFDAGPNPFSIAAADLNGDGRADVAITIENETAVTVLMNTTLPGAASPSFTARVNVATPASPRAVALDDVDGDGRADLVVGSAGGVSIIVNTTTPGSLSPAFGSRDDFATQSFPGSLAIADVNGDGKPDVSCANNSPNGLAIHINATARSTAAPAYDNVDLALGDAPFGVVVADFNGDGRPDLAAVNELSDSLSVVFNIGAPGALANLENVTGIPVGDGPVAVAAGDLNNDGRPDLAIANRLSGTITVLLNQTAPGAVDSTFGVDPFVTGNAPRAIVIADVNADGFADLLTADEDDNTVSVLINTGGPGAANATFSDRSTFAATTPNGIVVVELNGDGRPDLAVSTSVGGTGVVVLLNTAVQAGVASFASAVGVDTTSPPFGIAAGDLNGDGRADLVTSDVVGNTASVFLNTTPAGGIAPSFAPQQSFACGLSPVAIAVGDLNGDGKLDLAVANNGSNSASVLLNTTGTGAAAATFSSSIDIPTGSTPRGVAIAELTGDGRLDVVVTNEASDNLTVLSSTSVSVCADPPPGSGSNGQSGVTCLTIDTFNVIAGNSYTIDTCDRNVGDTFLVVSGACSCSNDDGCVNNGSICSCTASSTGIATICGSTFSTASATWDYNIAGVCSLP
ncbi:MAG: FG-GAP-like repeat-containing protein [Deltaproteobacteria bacterium]|nr:FG-GAP-like repeat-containing protein [Deltaproteobacteria bacterium]